jgi:hypothetical protein
MTNLDRLHKTIQQARHDPRDGRTFATCHNVAGLLETTPFGATIVWVLPRMGWADHIKPMLAGVLEEHGIVPRRWLRYAVEFERERSLHFVPIEDIREWSRGRKDLFRVDDLGEVVDRMTDRQYRMFLEWVSQ